MTRKIWVYIGISGIRQYFSSKKKAIAAMRADGHEPDPEYVKGCYIPAAGDIDAQVHNEVLR